MKGINLFDENCIDINLPKCRLLLTDIPYEEVNRQFLGIEINKTYFEIASKRIR